MTNTDMQPDDPASLTRAQWAEMTQRPGKFEGSEACTPYFYTISLDGFRGDHDSSADQTYIKFIVEPEDEAIFPELEPIVEVRLYESDQGFCSVTFDEEDSDDDPAPSNTPTLYIDGESQSLDFEQLDELERVQLEFLDSSNGMQSEAQERAPLGWCNSASINLDRSDDSVTVTISVGDPRGAFAFTVRRRPDTGTLLMHVPYPGEGMPHMALKALQNGTYEIG